MRVMTRRHLLSVALMGAAVTGFAAVTGEGVALADAPSKVRAEVMVIHATKGADPGSFDPRIGDVSRLKDPPFNAFNTYKLLDKQTLELEAGKNGQVKLPNGRALQVAYTGPTADKRHDVSASISQADGASFLKLLRVSASVGQTFFVAGQSYQGGNLVLAITLR
jgi:hypothetical protein